MATDSILTEQSDYERGREDGARDALLLSGDALRQQLADLTTRLSVASATIHAQKKGIEERDRAIRDAAARSGDVIEPCVVCRRLARVGTRLVCEACK